MESPPSSSSWSHTFILSEDSGLLLSNDLTSSCTSSFESKNDLKYFLYEDTDTEEKSLSHDDSAYGMPDIICGQNYNTLKKGPSHWCELKSNSSPIEPPEEFQDKPLTWSIQNFCHKISEIILNKALLEVKEEYLKSRRIMERLRPISQAFLQTTVPKQRPNKPQPVYFSPDFIPFSPCHTHYLGMRPSSRSSMSVCSRRSSSHSSLYVPTTGKADDSSFITQAVSHDALSAVFSPASDKISDLYNVPFDSDIYAVPLDVVRHREAGGVVKNNNKRRNTSSSCRELKEHLVGVDKPKWSATGKFDFNKSVQYQSVYDTGGVKRHSLAGSSTRTAEPIHMTLKEVRQYLQTMYSSSSDTSEANEHVATNTYNNNNDYHKYNLCLADRRLTDSKPERNKKMFLINVKSEKIEDTNSKNAIISPKKKEENKKRKLLNFRQALLGVFKFKKCLPIYTKTEINNKMGRTKEETQNLLGNRALPPLPGKQNKPNNAKQEEQTLDFATSIQKVKDYGWYWGPISSEAAEKILSNEPDGSFIVRDSSDDHYIFSLTFKLNSSVRHVRIEHDQGNFSFGSCTKFKSQTIVDFIENAVEHSRSGRYLFFLHRRPVIGPVRVQLLHPVSRFKQIQSLQHMCRFVIHKNIRRDLIPNLPLPRRMIDYLNTPQYYSEHFVDLQT